METQEPELRRQLHLTTEDLRFADFVVRQVSEDRHDVFLDGVGWEGGDEWIRTQFKAYLLCLLRTSLLPGKCSHLKIIQYTYVCNKINLFFSSLIKFSIFQTCKVLRKEGSKS